MLCRQDVYLLVITLAKCDESGNDVISRGVAVVEWLVTEPMGQAVDAESGLLDEEDSQDAGVNEATQPVVEHHAAEDGGNYKRHGDNGLQVVLVLPDNDRVLVEIGNIGTADSPGVLLHDHPSNATNMSARVNQYGGRSNAHTGCTKDPCGLSTDPSRCRYICGEPGGLSTTIWHYPQLPQPLQRRGRS